MDRDEIETTLDRDPYVSNHPQSRHFWQAAALGRMLLPRCRACGQAHWYPRPFCPHCGSDGLDWQPASGLATLYSFSALRRLVPASIVGYVRLAEGPTMLTNIVGCTLDELRIDMPVRLEFGKAKEGRSIPIFTPEH